MKRVKNPWFINTIGAIAILIGVLRVPTLFFNLPILNTVGDTFAITPFPVPYNHPMITDPSDMKRGLSFTCEKKGYHDIKSKWSHYVRGYLSGPHRRTITFVSYFDLAFHSRDNDEEKKFETITRYYFCDNGPLALAASCQPDIDAVVITFNDQHYGVTIRESRVQCKL
jgi:hypothetical protein